MDYRSLGCTGMQGVTVSRPDAGYQPPALTDPFLRRRTTRLPVRLNRHSEPNDGSLPVRTTWNASARRPAGRPAVAVFGSRGAWRGSADAPLPGAFGHAAA